MDKRGAVGRQITFGITFFIMSLIALGIVGGVWLFYGGGEKFKQEESAVLNSKLLECINENSLNEDFKNNFYNYCGLNEEIIKKNNGIKICLNSNLNDCLKTTNAFFTLGSNFEICGLEGISKNDNFPKCSIREFDKNGDRVVLITISKQDVKNEQNS